MGRYVRQFEISVTHADGEVITALVKPATTADVYSLDVAETHLARTFQERMKDVIVELKGPTDAAGVQIPKEEFLSAAYFTKAVLDIGTEWLRRASPQNP